MTTPSVFVVGAPRSGTTLLRRILSGHPELELPHELRVLDLAAGVGWSAGHGGTWPDAGDVASPADLSLGWPFVEVLYRRLARHTGATMLGDKYPPDALRIPHLVKLVPHARIVHLVRDGRDVVSSSMRAFVERAAWRRSLTPPTASDMAQSWALHVMTARRDAAALGAGRFLEVRYEALTGAATQTCGRVLDFLGLAPHAAVEEAAAEVHAGRSWRETLHPDDLRDAMATGGFTEALEASGYALDGPADVDPDARRFQTVCRSLRLPVPPPEDVAELLAAPQRAASLFAAMHARDRAEEGVSRAHAEWMHARGLPAHIARVLAGGGD